MPYVIHEHVFTHAGGDARSVTCQIRYDRPGFARARGVVQDFVNEHYRHVAFTGFKGSINYDELTVYFLSPGLHEADPLAVEMAAAHTDPRRI